MLQQELNTRLFTDFGHPRDIIRLITHERLEIDKLSWCEAHFFHEVIWRKGLKLSHTFLGNFNHRMLIRQLNQILVPTDNGNIKTILLC
ncbi:Uncharacterised protein [Streptococcus pneumoniae]|nr:Uncharacterised protein [Streptococcus pneumoniae]CEY08916.1 Uncharacterised protein [Streptococcus pneumoniae]CIV67066.1 Uncharacterised protein [Streptococcus pneumoniae]CIV99697.1 Uncharacterised protein [Streptococcus pneumoniae]CIW01712.1 Uncharacterised protein [Streptococcus pneumoniae]